MEAVTNKRHFWSFASFSVVSMVKGSFRSGSGRAWARHGHIQSVSQHLFSVRTCRWWSARRNSSLLMTRADHCWCLVSSGPMSSMPVRVPTS